MNCDETRGLLHAYLDGELDLARSLEIEQHLQECAACSDLSRAYRELQTVMSSGALHYPAPSALRSRILNSLEQVSGPDRPYDVALRLPEARWRLWRPLALAATIALAAVTLWTLTRGVPTPSARDLLAQEVVSSHIRSLMADHLTDIASSNQHTVKPWFNGKLDFSPPVKDFADQGYPLVGGRLDYVGDRPVAALVYRREQHVINLLVWPSPETADQIAQLQDLQGYHLIHWTAAGMTYWAVSDVAPSGLMRFVELVQQ